MSSEQRTVIGEFDVKDVGRCRAYRVGGADTVSLSRIHPDSKRGKNIARVKRLTSSSPEGQWPENWSGEQRADAEAKVRLLWKHHTEQQAGNA